uniref:hypothetical protein n=1 Tax=Candidatus Enterococcus willemsii TaxID=1857215 RepID=UPI00403F8457
MLNLVYGHWLKTKRTPIRWLSIVLPIVYASVLFGYFEVVHPGSFVIQEQIHGLFLFFSIAMMFCLSFYIPMIYGLEKEAGNFGELRIGVSRNILWISHLLFIWLLVIFITLLMTTCFIGLHLLIQTNLSQLSIGSFMLIPVICSLPLIILYQFLSLVSSYVGTILVGSILTLSGILLGTTDLGNIIWYYLPWVWPIKLTYRYVFQLIDNSAMAKEYAVLLGLTVVLGICLLAGVLFWYNRWEGTSSLEE